MSEPSNVKGKKLSMPVRLMVAIVVVITGAVLVNRIALIFSYSEDIAGIEPVFAYYILKICNYEHIYQNIKEIPFSNCQYAPLYFETIGRAIRTMLPLEWVDQRNIYLVSRGGNLLFNIATSFIIGLLVMKISANKLLGFIFGCLSFWAFSTYHYAIRPDSLKTLFIALTLFYFFKIYINKQTRAIHAILFILFACLACFTKQDAAVVIAALVMAGLLFDNFRKWAVIGTGVIAANGLLFLFYFIQYGDAFVDNITIGFKFNYSLEYFIWVIWKGYKHWLIFISLSIITALYYSKATYKKAGTWSIFVLIFSFIFISILSTKWGAGVNYFYDIIMLNFICLAYLVHNSRKENTAKYYHTIIAIAALFLFLDIHNKNIQAYNKNNTTNDKLRYSELGMAKQIILNNVEKESFYLYTLEKYICNEFYESCLFPAYETSDPQLLMATLRYDRGTDDLTLPIKPDIHLYDSPAFIEQLKNEEVLALMPKQRGFIPYYDITETSFRLIDSTEKFYLYRLEY